MCVFWATLGAILPCTSLAENPTFLFHSEALRLAVFDITGPDDHVIGDGRVTDPLLLPVEHPFAAVAARRRGRSLRAGRAQGSGLGMASPVTRTTRLMGSPAEAGQGGPLG